jgi:uncharacterized protein (TIGR03435 family)
MIVEMKNLVRWLVAFAALSSGALFAQDLIGAWQGTLQAGRELRTVVRVSKTDAGYKAVFYSIDQGGQGIPISTITLKDSVVTYAVPGIGGAYEGKLSPDGNSISGNWTQGPKPLPLNLTRATPQSAWAIPEPPKPLKPMAADANPVFAVATIKPSNPNLPGRGFRVQPGQFSTFNTPLSALITFAYDLQSKQVTGGPSWLDSEKYDIVARPDGEGQPNEKQWKIMVRKLLADRFKLAFHRDTKELSVYALSVAKGGSKLTPSEGDPNGLPGIGFGPFGRVAARNANMVDFAHLMQNTALDRPIVDQTGLSGRYDFTLSWVPDEFQYPDFKVSGGPQIPANTEGVDLFTAIQQQLGLKLDATKAPAEVLVIDHAEKPSEN